MAKAKVSIDVLDLVAKLGISPEKFKKHIERTANASSTSRKQRSTTEARGKALPNKAL